MNELIDYLQTASEEEKQILLALIVALSKTE